MKSVKIAVVVCSLFAAAAAHAQNEAPAASGPGQVAQSAAPQAPANRAIAKPASQDECVGPVSFCTIYFGS